MRSMRAKVLPGSGRYRDDTTASMSVEGRRTTWPNDGGHHMAGAAVGVVPALSTPTRRDATFGRQDTRPATPQALRTARRPAERRA